MIRSYPPSSGHPKAGSGPRESPATPLSPLPLPVSLPPMPLADPSLAAQRQSLEPPLLQKAHTSSSQKTVTSSASGTVSTPRVVPTGQPGGKSAMALSRGSGRGEKLQLSPELLRPMTLLSVLASLDRSPDVSHLGPGQKWISCCPTQHLARVQPPASCLVWTRRGSLPSLLRFTRDKQRERLRGRRCHHRP